jgi:predicted molibdopterin-dependent oxidoreductase YjgC
MMSQINENIPATRILAARGEPIDMSVNGHPVEAYAGETVSTVLLTSGHIIFQYDAETHMPRSLFCGMGVCYNCLVTIDGVPNIRACVTPVAAGMVVETKRDPHD